MRSKLNPVTSLGWFSMALVVLAGAQVQAPADDLKLQAFLLWGTNEVKPPEGRPYKPVEVEIRQKLKDLPLKWTNWFEVNRKDFAASQGTIKEVSMSAKCQLHLRKLSGAELEVSLIGKGKEVMKRKQSLPKGEMLVLGGNAPNSTAWLVVLKRVE